MKNNFILAIAVGIMVSILSAVPVTAKTGIDPNTDNYSGLQVNKRQY